MINGIRVQGAYDAHLVRDLWEMLKDGADSLSGSTVAAEFVVGSAAGELLSLQLGDWLPFSKALRHRLSVHPLEDRLVIKGLQMRGPARHVEENDSLGFWSQRQLGIGRRLLCPQHRAQGDAAQACGGLPKEGSTACSQRRGRH